MIVRVVHGRAAPHPRLDQPGAVEAAGRPRDREEADDLVHPGSRDPEGIGGRTPRGADELRARFQRAAAGFNGLETLIVGWRDRADIPRAGASEPDVVVTVWMDAESMVRAFGSDESAFVASLGIRLEIDHGESFELTSRTFASLPAPMSVLRIVSMRAEARGEADFFEHLRAIQQRLADQGLIASHIARRVDRDGIEAVIVGVWNDRAAIEAATGDPLRPAYLRDVEPWIRDFSIELYAALEVAPRLPMASGPPIIILDGARRVVDLTPAAAATLGRTQDEAVGMLVEDLAALEEKGDGSMWMTLLDDPTPGDKAGGTAWFVPPDGQVMIRWRMRRDVPVPGRHTVLVRRSLDREPTGADLDAALADAFPRVAAHLE